MKQYNVMLKPASSLCNLRCRYCFYCDVADLREVRSFGIMTDETMQNVLRSLERSLSPGDQITVVSQGGEPMLAGLDFSGALQPGRTAGTPAFRFPSRCRRTACC